MTEATRTALHRVAEILHQAGWDEPTAVKGALTSESLQEMRSAYGSMLREDHFTILQRTLGTGLQVEDAGRAMGIGPEASRSLFSEALARLVGFAEVAEQQGVTSDKTIQNVALLSN